MVGIELWFLYTTLLHNVTFLCMTFEVTSCNKLCPVQDFVMHRWMDGQTDRRMDGQGDSSAPPKLHLWGI